MSASDGAATVLKGFWVIFFSVFEAAAGLGALFFFGGSTSFATPDSNQSTYSSFSVIVSALESRCVRITLNSSGGFFILIASFANSLEASKPFIRFFVESEYVEVNLIEAAIPSCIDLPLETGTNLAVEKAEEEGIERNIFVHPIMIKTVVDKSQNDRILRLFGFFCSDKRIILFSCNMLLNAARLKQCDMNCQIESCVSDTETSSSDVEKAQQTTIPRHIIGPSITSIDRASRKNKE